MANSSGVAPASLAEHQGTQKCRKTATIWYPKLGSQEWVLGPVPLLEASWPIQSPETDSVPTSHLVTSGVGEPGGAWQLEG